MKYLMFFAFLGVVWWVWKKRNEPAKKTPANRDPAPQKMLACAHCGVHFPENDGQSEGGKTFCSEAHRLAARAAER